MNHRPVDFGSTSQRVTTLQVGSQVDRLTQFIERQKGQRGEFWMPTGTEDMTIATTAANGASSFVVAGREVFDNFNSSEVYSGVAIYMRDRRIVYRKINTMILLSGNTQIAVTQPFTLTINPADVLRVSWLRPARCSSDDATIEYLTDSTTQWQVSTVSVTYSADTMNYADPDGAAIWVMDNWGEDAEDIMGEMDYMVNIATLFGDVRRYEMPLVDALTNTDLWEIAG